MTPDELYIRYLNKAEKNGTTDNLSTDKKRFSILYNELKNRVIKWYLQNKNLDSIKDIEVLLTDDKKITPHNIQNKQILFKLPEDFLESSFVWGKASRGKCVLEDISLFEIRNEDRGQILNNSLFSPSFEYREFPYNYSNKMLKIYREEGTEINQIYLSYYRFPNKINLIDPDNPESDFQNTEIELNDEVLDRIISAMVGDFKMNNGDQSFQVDKLRQNENLNQ